MDEEEEEEEGGGGDSKESKERICNENKLEIVEKALNACCQQLVYYNKLFLNPMQSVQSKPVLNRQQMCADKKAMKARIDAIKQHIDQRRKTLVLHIQTLRKLRSETKQIAVSIPHSVRSKIVQNMEYGTHEQEEDGRESAVSEQRTQRIISMIHDNKKKLMIELKPSIQALKANEVRLKQRAQQIQHDEQRLQRFIQLKQQNKHMHDDTAMMSVALNNHNNNDNDDDEKKGHDRNYRKERAISMASSIDSTIHGSVSPFMLDKLEQQQLEQANTVNFMKLQKTNQIKHATRSARDFDAIAL